MKEERGCQKRKVISYPIWQKTGKIFLISNVNVEISDNEKTIIDCIDKPGYCGGIEEIVKSVYFAKEEIEKL